MSRIFLIFLGTAILFFIPAAPFYILTNSAQVFQFLHIISNTSYFLRASSFLLLFVLFFWDKVLLRRLGWPRTHNSPASASWVLGRITGIHYHDWF
jgi:hypothetical protein